MPDRVVVADMPLEADPDWWRPWTVQPGSLNRTHVVVLGAAAATERPPLPEATAILLERAEVLALPAADTNALIQLRPYQRECVAAVADAWWKRGIQRPLVVMATGGGKTVVAAELIRIFHQQSTGDRVLFLAHRRVLLDQTADKIRLVSPATRIGIVQAKHNELGREVTIASIQTAGHRSGRRLQQLLDAGPYGLVICDEAHRAVSSTWTTVLATLQEANPRCLVLGMTATPCRSDGTALDTVFDQVVFERNVFDMIQQGWLVPPRGYRVHLDIDLDHVDSKDGDYVAPQLSKLMNTPQINAAVVHAWMRYGMDRKFVVFAVDVAHARALAQEFVDAGYPASVLSASTKERERTKIYSDFRDGRTKLLVNVDVLCVDEATEILTVRGFVGIDDLSDDDLVANWYKDGSIQFRRPQRVVRRQRLPDEPMVSVEAKRFSIRVTGNHRMMVRHQHWGWHVRRADQLINKRRLVPVSGHAEPLPVLPTQPEPISPQNFGARVRSASYTYRKQGIQVAEAKQLATSRISERLGMRYTDPENLTIAECWLIGFWIGDGTATHLRSGGIEYRLAQSTVYPVIIERVDSTISQCAVDVVRREHPAKPGINPYVTWSLPRGTGFGPQKRRGLFHLEPYLNKTGSFLLWGLNKPQFDAFLDGLWNADGNHHAGYGPSRNNFRHIQGCDIPLYNLLQAIASCRGYATALRPVRNRHPDRHRDQMDFRFTEKPDQMLADHRLQLEAGWQPERVWCVTTDSGFIVTRRRGKVVVTGNSEGWDEPSAEGVLFARPTQSQTVYLQALGRGLRLFPLKTECLVIDCVGNTEKHQPVQLATLAGFEPELPINSDEDPEPNEEAGDSDDPTVLGADIRGEEFSFHTRQARTRYQWRETGVGWILQVPRIGYYLVAWNDRSRTRATIRFYDQRKGRRDTVPREVCAQPIAFEIAYSMVEAEMDRIFNARANRRREAPEEVEDAPDISFVDFDDGLDEPTEIPEEWVLRGAEWRDQPISDRQRTLLTKLSAKRTTLPTTAGEASDLIVILQVEYDAKWREPATEKQIAYIRINGLDYKPEMTKKAAARQIWQHRKRAAR